MSLGVFLPAPARVESSDNSIETQNFLMRLSNNNGVTICSSQMRLAMKAGLRQAERFAQISSYPKRRACIQFT